MSGDSALQYVGTLTGHRDWVTAIACTYEQSNLVVSSSRDKTLMIWELTPDGENPGYARRSLHGHGQCVASAVLSSDGQYALSGSWDKTMRLWDLNTGSTIRTFKGHTKDVNSVAFSGDNRQIVLWQPGQDHQVVEHLGRVQVHDRRRHAHRLGELSWLLPISKDAFDCVRRLGQAGEGVELEQLQASHQLGWPHGRGVCHHSVS